MSVSEKEMRRFNVSGRKKELRDEILFFRNENEKRRKKKSPEETENVAKKTQDLKMYFKEQLNSDEYNDNIPRKKDVRVCTMDKLLSRSRTRKFAGNYHQNWMWSLAQRDFRDLLLQERQRTGITATERKEVFHELTDFYFTYIRLYSVLDQVYDQIAHPQKRILIRKILDFMILRAMEIRNTFVAIENSEYIYFDDICMENGWLPTDATMTIPRYYFYDQDPGVDERLRWITEYREANPFRSAKEVSPFFNTYKVLFKWAEPVHTVDWTTDECIVTIQSFLRHRAMEDNWRFMLYHFEDDVREAARVKYAQERAAKDKNKAATIIQKLVRGYLSRRRVHRMRLKELTFLGLVWGDDAVIADSKNQSTKQDYVEKRRRIEELCAVRRQHRNHLAQVYEQALVVTENRIRTYEGPEMTERLSHQFRNRFIQIREETGRLPEISRTEFAGDSMLLSADHHLQGEGLERRTAEPEGSSGKKKDKKKSADKKKKDGPKAKAQKKEVGPVALALGKPVFLNDMVNCNREYNVNWRQKDERNNADQKHDEELIRSDKRKLVVGEVRQQVDNLLKAELQELKQALDGRKKKGKSKKGKGKKGKGKKGKKGKKKKGKDLTPDRTFRSLYEDLLCNGVIREYPKIRLTDLYGTCSVVNGTIRNYWADKIAEKNLESDGNFTGDANPLPSIGDVKIAIKDLVVFPMGSPTIHSMGTYYKSLLIAGPQGVGKKTLVHAVCTEIGATLMDFTATNIVGKYPGKSGLTMLMHLANKVGRLAQPTVILIDDCEKMYQKRVPKTDKSEPKRLKKQLGKFLKGIGADDRIILLGLTSEPWVAPMKMLKKDYQKILFIPRPDYGVRYEIWKELLGERNVKCEIDDDVRATLLAKLSDGWTYTAMKRAVNMTMAVHKMRCAEQERNLRLFNSDMGLVHEAGGKKCRVGRTFVKPEEFLEALAQFEPMFLEQEKAWISWWNKTPQMKVRLAAQTGTVTVKTTKGKSKGKKKKR